MSAADCEVFENFLDVMLPRGGLVAVFYNVYFDESGTHQESPVMTMAGYLFEKREARQFSREWQRDLDSLGLSCAHMTDCALGFGEYKKLSMRQRIRSEELLIKHIRKRSLLGISLAVDHTAFNEGIDGSPIRFSAYTTLLLVAVQKIRDFVNKNCPNARVAYFFEAGHASANEACAFMNAIPVFGWKDYFHYSGHAFLDKKDAHPLQAADMLAWQHRHYLVRALKGHHEPRKDMLALVRDHDLFSHMESDHIAMLRRNLTAIAAARKGTPMEWMMEIERAFNSPFPPLFAR